MISFNEVFDFDLDDFMPQLGWIGDKSLKICRKEDSPMHYLFDRETSKLYEILSDTTKFNNYRLYDDVVAAYLIYKQL